MAPRVCFSARIIRHLTLDIQTPLGIDCLGAKQVVWAGFAPRIEFLRIACLLRQSLTEFRRLDRCNWGQWPCFFWPAAEPWQLFNS